MKRLIFGLLFMLIGGGVVSWGSRATSKVSATRNWPTVSGTVLSSDVVVDSAGPQSAGGSIRYDTEARYRFTVNGQRYESNVVVLGAAKSFTDRTLEKRRSLPIRKGAT